MQKYNKAAGAAVAGVVGVLGVLGWTGGEIDTEVITAAVAAGLALFGTYIAPKNKE